LNYYTIVLQYTIVWKCGIYIVGGVWLAERILFCR